MQVGLIEAARLVGKNKGTLCKHRQQGKLSSCVDALGNTVYDVAELQRVYGHLPGLGAEMAPRSAAQQDKHICPANPASDRLELEHTKRELALTRELLDATRAHLETALRALPAAEPTPQHPNTETPRRRRFLGIPWHRRAHPAF